MITKYSTINSANFSFPFRLLDIVQNNPIFLDDFGFEGSLSLTLLFDSAVKPYFLGLELLNLVTEFVVRFILSQFEQDLQFLNLF